MTKRQDDPRDMIEAQRRRIALEGLPAAVGALIEVCNSKTAPAPAKATAGTSLLRAAGLFEKPGEQNQGKQAHEMTADELARAIADMRRGVQAEVDTPASDEAVSVFD